jgi:hypothetical protein
MLADDWMHLENLWRHNTPHAARSASHPRRDQQAEVRALYAAGISLDEVLCFLYGTRPDFPAFQAWVMARHAAVPAADGNRHAPVLTAADLAAWDRDGYLVLRGAIAAQQCAAARAAIWEFLGAAPDDPRSWYQPHPAQRGLMLQYSNHPALAANRDSPLIRAAFEQLYGSTAIFKTIDKVSFHPPETDDWRFAGSPLHWDVSLHLPIPFRLQGLLYLSDCTASGGAFHCVPGFHRRIEAWMAQVPAEMPPREWAVRTLTPTAVPGAAGDFVIWHQALPHCATPNRSALPRLVQYLTYHPDHYRDHEEWI